MTHEERESIIRRLFGLFPAIMNLVSQEELGEWHDTLDDLEFLVASLTITIGKRQWKRLPSHAEFRELYDQLAPPRRAQTRPGDPLRCAGRQYVIVEADLAADFAAEREAWEQAASE